MPDKYAEFIREAFINNSFSYKSMDLILKKTMDSSFSYLYNLQRSLINLNSISYYTNDYLNRKPENIGDLYLKNGHPWFGVDFVLLPPSSDKIYRESKYYNQEISFINLINNKGIFPKIPILIIDDRVIWNYKIKINKDDIDFILPFNNHFITAKIPEKEATKTYYFKKYEISNTGEIIVKNPETGEILRPLPLAYGYHEYYQRCSIDDKDVLEVVPDDKEGYDDSLMVHINDVISFIEDIQIGEYVQKIIVTEDKFPYNLHFVPIRIERVRQKIIEKINDGSTIKSIIPDINKIIENYYIIESYDNDKITILSYDKETRAYINHKIQIYFIENHYYESVNISTTKLNISSNNISIDKSNFENYNDDYMKYGTVFATVQSFNSIKNKFNENGSHLIYLSNENEKLVGNLSDDILTEIQNGTKVKVSLIEFRNLELHSFYTNNNYFISDGVNPNIMVINNEDGTPYRMPIPIENCFIIKKTNNTTFEIIDNDIVHLCYPNIYVIDDPLKQKGDKYFIYYFYYRGHDLHYTAMDDFYFYYLKNKFHASVEEILDDIYHDRLSSFTDEEKQTLVKVLSFYTYHHKYGDQDFIHRYSQIEENHDKPPIMYKIETLKEWLRVEPFVLQEYVNEQKRKGNVYYLFTNTIDLNERIRTNCQLELNSDYEFDREMYVFALYNYNQNREPLNLNIFIDGLLLEDYYQERNDYMEYIYIPCEMLTDDSFIEIELTDSFKLETEVTFNDMNQKADIVVVEKDENVFPTRADAVVFSNTEFDKKTRYDISFFDITTHYIDRYGQTDALIPEHGHININDPKKRIKFPYFTNITIKPNSEEVLNIPVKIRLSKLTENIRYMVKEDGIVYLEFVDNSFGYHKDFLRIYVNGRLLPRSKYQFYPMYYLPRIRFVDKFKAGDIIYFNISPYRYTEIFYAEDIPYNESGLVSLKGIINKPFDIKYYDVYLNGRKLSLNNAITIDPWTIKLLNIKSNYNLVIYEKERDWEYFGLDYNTKSYYYSVEDLLNEPFMTDDDKKSLIDYIVNKKKEENTTIKENTNDEEKEDWDDSLIIYFIFDSYYHDELIPKTKMNPDLVQSSCEVLLEYYPEIYDKYITNSYSAPTDLNAIKRKKDYPPVLCLNPDKQFDGASNDHSQSVYFIGNPGDIDFNFITDDFLTLLSENAVQNRVVTNALKNYADANHNHDDRYYTKEEMDNIIDKRFIKMKDSEYKVLTDSEISDIAVYFTTDE